MALLVVAAASAAEPPADLAVRAAPAATDPHESLPAQRLLGWSTASGSAVVETAGELAVLRVQARTAQHGLLLERVGAGGVELRFAGPGEDGTLVQAGRGADLRALRLQLRALAARPRTVAVPVALQPEASAAGKPIPPLAPEPRR